MHRYYHSPVTVILHVCSPSRNKPTVTRVWIIYFPFLFLSPPLFEKQLGDSIIVFWSCIVAMAQQSKSTSLNRKGKENAPPPPNDIIVWADCLSLSSFWFEWFLWTMWEHKTWPIFPQNPHKFQLHLLGNLFWYYIMINKYTLSNTFV